ncbi:class I SAM-dependent methyltransferase [Armatimonas rosea]|uniref:Ubiquinone/menaquinone biosynthesis C-methylase UbiE n=1 Tax=Armatimonas rosea TaxID=685828 RepID=A0A7W9SS77_ARMRO|nr:class I SAM-dependent methyltransferase [Armatimonas rosea]MBB6051219.1 ubiquinone/menaquinone biosynthesis C-methylase UbiE [Armatimonas rosea]
MQTPPKKPPYIRRAFHDPNGTGIFYLGREIAQVMGHEGADWLDRPEREEEEAPTLLVKSLKLKPGMVVADIGAGSGYLSFMMAKQLVPGGKVLAVDIQPEMLAIIEQKKKQNGIGNVEVVLGKTDDPKLPEKSCDLQIMVDVYHEFDKPYEMISAMVKALKIGGRIVFVEYRKEDPAVPIKEVHKLSVAQVKKEMALFPLKFVENNQTLPRQHILIFERVK